jgi:ankyrin repeat protein
VFASRCRSNNHVEVAQILIEAGFDKAGSIQDLKNKTAMQLGVAARSKMPLMRSRGQAQDIRRTLQPGAFDTAKAQRLLTPLMELCEADDVDEVRRLLASGTVVDINARIDGGSTALTVAADSGATNVLGVLIKELPGYVTEAKDANASLLDGTTLLMLACRYGHADTCSEQIEHCTHKLLPQRSIVQLTFASARVTGWSCCWADALTRPWRTRRVAPAPSLSRQETAG